MNGASIQSLLGTAESDEVLDHRRDILALQALDVAITDFSSKEWIFREGFLDLSHNHQHVYNLHRGPESQLTRP